MVRKTRNNPQNRKRIIQEVTVPTRAPRLPNKIHKKGITEKKKQKKSS